MQSGQEQMVQSTHPDCYSYHYIFITILNCFKINYYVLLKKIEIYIFLLDL